VSGKGEATVELVVVGYVAYWLDDSLGEGVGSAGMRCHMDELCC